MVWPDYPDNRLIVNGVDTTMRFQMALLDGYTLSPPEPKVYTVDIPGGDGVIDLTEALTGDVAYNNRAMEFSFAIIDMQDHRSFEDRKRDISNFLHGKAFDYRLTFDPDYIYHGRFTVSGYGHAAFPSGILGTIKISIDADPYKSKGRQTLKLNGTGGKLFQLKSGRKKVHPTIECTQPTKIRKGDVVTNVGAGTWRLNDILMEEGLNDIYINSRRIEVTTWGDVGEGGKHQMTWDQAEQYRWDDLHKFESDDDIPQRWDDLASSRWSDISTKTWKDLDFRYNLGATEDTIVYFQYDWKDL